MAISKLSLGSAQWGQSYGISNSNGQSKRLIEQGAVKINDKVITDKEKLLINQDFIKHPSKKNHFYLIVLVGKKKYGLVELVN